ncbi:MAG: hypothetical protein U5K36_10990 [Roseovarius sp.]|nr:hypothetical protein [Roseovarius sp.]
MFSRKDAQGNEIGDAYLARCVQSWRDCGFAAVTVNSVNEALHPLIADLGVEVVRVPRDAAAINGRPHVFTARPARRRAPRLDRAGVRRERRYRARDDA